MLKNILLRNVSVYDPYTSCFAPELDILVSDGVVARMEKGILPEAGWEIVEGNNLCASAGWTDCHTHFENFDPALTYPSLGVTCVHDAGSFGHLTFHRMHECITRMPFPATTYLYVGCWGVTNGELKTLDNIQAEPFLETAKQYRGEILGAKIRIDPRVNCDTRKSLRMAKELAVKAELPLIVHPSRTEDSLESILEVLEKDDVYTHSYSHVAPSLFDENGKIKQVVWDAMKRGVRFDLAHGSNNFHYDIARRAIEQGFKTETISTDMHLKNFNRPGISLAGVMTKAIHTGFTVTEALNRVITAPSALLGTTGKQTTIEVGKPADITVFRVVEEPIDLPDSKGVVETCETQILDVATVIGGMLNRSLPTAVVGGDFFWTEKE